jgi:hypothetical protein
VRAPRQFRIAVVWASIVIVGIAAGGHNKLKERRRTLMRIAISTWRDYLCEIKHFCSEEALSLVLV